MLLDPVQVLVGPGQAVEKQSAVLIKNRRLEAFGDEARRKGRSEALEPQDAGHQLLAPCLVDCHSGLPEPFHGRGETLESLVRTAGSAGFGQLALLPRTLHGQREQPDHLQGFQRSDCDVSVHLWGGFSSGGSGVELTAHGDLLEAGAVGLSDGRSMPPIALLDRALTLGEMNAAPLLIPPLDLALRGEGLLREGVNALRAGWPLAPQPAWATPAVSPRPPTGADGTLHR
jgi:dihydroorotase